MKVPVIRSFTDKKTNNPYNAGRIYESTDMKRIKYLQDKGYLLQKPLPGSKKKAKSEEKATIKQEKHENIKQEKPDHVGE